MDTQFYIIFNLKTAKGTESFARFFVGNNEERAYDIFAQMKGRESDETNILYMDFMGTAEGVPVNLKMIVCTLDQLTENFRTITREVFKLFNLEETK